MYFLVGFVQNNSYRLYSHGKVLSWINTKTPGSKQRCNISPAIIENGTNEQNRGVIINLSVCETTASILRMSRSAFHVPINAIISPFFFFIRSSELVNLSAAILKAYYRKVSKETLQSSARRETNKTSFTKTPNVNIELHTSKAKSSINTGRNILGRRFVVLKPRSIWKVGSLSRFPRLSSRRILINAGNNTSNWFKVQLNLLQSLFFKRSVKSPVQNLHWKSAEGRLS